MIYHLRALRHSRKLWQPFRGALENWLGEWNPPEKRLLIIGPSGGYCLSPLWLRRFDEVVCLDPDRTARLIFKSRFSGPRITWSHENYLENGTTLEKMSAFQRFVEAHPHSAVLFSNFLGQLHLLTDLSPWKQGVDKMLMGRSWASFHDRVSGPLRPAFEQPLVSPVRLSDPELIERLYPPSSGQVELVDHDTEGFFPKTREHTYFYWELMPGSYHLIEAVRDQSRG